MSVIFSNPDYLLEGYAEKKCMVSNAHQLKRAY